MQSERPPLVCPFTDTTEKCTSDCPLNIVYKSTVGIVEVGPERPMTPKDFKEAFNNDPKIKTLAERYCVIANKNIE